MRAVISPRFERSIGWFVACVCVLAALAALWAWRPVLSMEARGALESDAHLYFTVGRGMLNGIPLWSGLFESKPPAMFQLAALSLVLTSGAGFAIALQMLVYAAIPGLLAGAGWIEARRRGRPAAVAAAIAAFGGLSGVLLDFWLEERAGGFQTESIGNLFVCMYLFLLSLWPRKLRRAQTAVLALLIFGAIWTKEPFIVPLFGCSLLFVQDLRHWLRAFVLPAFLAGVLELIVLLLTGSLGDYLAIYLPAMISTRVGTERFDPLYLRAFTIGRVYGNVTTYYTAPLLGYLLALLWVTFPLLRRAEEPSRWWHLLLAAGASVAAYEAIWIGFFPIARLNAWLLHGVLVDETSFPPAVGNLPWVLLILAALLAAAWKQRMLGSLALSAAALMMASLAAGISVYAPNHFAFAFPLFFALVLVAVRFLAAMPLTPLSAVFIALAVWAGFTYAPSERQLQLLTDRMAVAPATQTERIAKADGLLDACNIDRYGALDVFDRLSFARHSPLGPMVVMHFFEYLGWDHPLVLETQRVLRDDAKIIFNGNGADAERTLPLLADRFTEEAPDCAKPFLPIPNVQVLFRKS